MSNQYAVWSRSDFRNAIRVELMDTNTRWFTDSEINSEIARWQAELQEEFEFTWAISTLTFGTITSTNSANPQLRINIAGFSPAMLRNEAVYYNGFRLAGRNLQDLEVGNPTWRGDLGNGTNAGSPLVYDIPRLAVMYPDSQSILIWPCPPPPTGSSSNVFVFEYPVELSIATDSSTSGLPIWTQYSCRPYVCSRLFQRPGPINDLKKSLRYKAQYERAKLRVRRMWDNFLPERFRRLQPGQHYEWEILTPPPAWDVGTPSAQGTGT